MTVIGWKALVVCGMKSGVLCQMQVSRAGTSNHTRQILWNVITVQNRGGQQCLDEEEKYLAIKEPVMLKTLPCHEVDMKGIVLQSGRGPTFLSCPCI